MPVAPDGRAHPTAGTAQPTADAPCRRKRERRRLRRLLDARQETIGGVARNGQNPGRCRGSVGGVRPSLVVPCPALSGRAELLRAGPRLALPRRGGRLAPKGAAPPLRAVMVRHPGGSAEGESPSPASDASGSLRPRARRASGGSTLGGRPVTPTMGPSPNGPASEVAWPSGEEDDGPAAETRRSDEPFTTRRAPRVQPESGLEPPEDPARSPPDLEAGPPSSRLR
jgi:hypothetical protein